MDRALLGRIDRPIVLEVPGPGCRGAGRGVGEGDREGSVTGRRCRAEVCNRRQRGHGDCRRVTDRTTGRGDRRCPGSGRGEETSLVDRPDGFIAHGPGIGLPGHGQAVGIEGRRRELLRPGHGKVRRCRRDHDRCDGMRRAEVELRAVHQGNLINLVRDQRVRGVAYAVSIGIRTLVGVPVVAQNLRVGRALVGIGDLLRGDPREGCTRRSLQLYGSDPVRHDKVIEVNFVAGFYLGLDEYAGHIIVAERIIADDGIPAGSHADDSSKGCR
ncbi:hypothetical protein DSECCO2_449550 [anaerobic digester metagenome]